MSDQPPAVGTPPSADDQTMSNDWRILRERRWDWHDQYVIVRPFVDALVAELTRLRAELQGKRDECEMVRAALNRTNDLAVQRWSRIIVLAKDKSDTEARYTALLIDLRALVERWDKQRRDHASLSREYNHAGNQNLDAYNDGKAMALGDVLSELNFRLSREPHQDTPQ